MADNNSQKDFEERINKLEETVKKFSKRIKELEKLCNTSRFDGGLK